MNKVPLQDPRRREVKDLASATAVRDIWADAAKAVCEEAPKVRRRRRWMSKQAKNG